MTTARIVVSDTALRLSNAMASVGFVWLACTIYATVPFHQRLMDRVYRLPGLEFTGLESLLAIAGAYSVILVAFFLTEPAPHTSKSLRVLAVLQRTVRAPRKALREGLTSEDRLAVLSTLLKAFFGPLMVIILVELCGGAWAYGSALFETGLQGIGTRVFFDRYVFWFLFQVIFFVDVAVFTVGYLVELPKLGNTIRSVDPTLVGWAAALACYIPFNQVSAAVLGSPVENFPKFDNAFIHVSLNVVALCLLAVYASASVALGLKASNLTHRGIVARWPYSVIRHPAYTCKNMAWWIGCVPFVAASFERSWLEGAQAAGSMVAWTGVYVLRALTEEDHLRRVDGEYDQYAAKVRYRFIPRVI